MLYFLVYSPVALVQKSQGGITVPLREHMLLNRRMTLLYRQDQAFLCLYMHVCMCVCYPWAGTDGLILSSVIFLTQACKSPLEIAIPPATVTVSLSAYTQTLDEGPVTPLVHPTVLCVNHSPRYCTWGSLSLQAGD